MVRIIYRRYQDHERFRGVFGVKNRCLVCELEATLKTVYEAHRVLGKVVPKDQNAMISWAVKSGDSVYTNAGAAYFVLDDVTKGKNQPCGSAKRCIVCNLLHCECEDGPLSLDDLVDVLQDVISQSCWDDERKVEDDDL